MGRLWDACMRWCRVIQVTIRYQTSISAQERQKMEVQKEYGESQHKEREKVIWSSLFMGTVVKATES